MTMPTQMDCFVDEVKDGGNVTAIGVLLLETGVLENLDRVLHVPIAKRQGAGAKVGEIHWSKLGDLECGIAKEWLTSFFQAPLVFFVLVRGIEGEHKADMLTRLVATLEQDPRVMGGFDRRNTTVHLDRDDSDPRGFLRDLRHDFGLLRAFKWDSKGSRLIQLCDLLLGIAGRLTDKGPAQASAAEERRKDLIAFVHSEAARFAARDKINAILELQPDGLRFVLPEQAARRSK